MNKLIPSYSFALLGFAVWPFLTAQAQNTPTQQVQTSQSDFGGVGLIQMPTGRMATEGSFNVGATYNDDYLHYNASMQLLPWFETTIRFTHVQDLLLSNNPLFSADNKYTDKGIDIKLRILKESYWLPETSIGVRDIGGTGLFDSEYIAASKHLGVFDFTLGVGWGYIGNSGNLSGNKSGGFDCGRTGFKGKGGNVDFERWFTGCASAFAGLEYQTPWEPLSLKLEYDTNDYRSDYPVRRSASTMKQDSELNIGANYRFSQWGNLRLSYERGNTWTLGFNFNTNFSDLRPIWRDTPSPNYQPKASNEALATAEWESIASDLDNIAGLADVSIYKDQDKITLVGNLTKYRDPNKANSRIATILANKAPDVSQYRIIEVSAHQAMIETTIDTAQFNKVANNDYIGATMSDSTSVKNPAEPSGKMVLAPKRNWGYGASPFLQQSFGSSENFYLFNIGISARANYWFGNHLELAGSAYVNVYDNYDEFLYDVPPDGTDLFRVRTLVRQYINENPARLNNLQLTWLDKLNDNWYMQAYGGYLEMMFAGVGGEVLYRPLHKNWAFGVDANYVAQRDPDSPFKIFKQESQFDPIINRPYRVQTGTLTGHLSAYYQPQWKWLPNTLIKVSAGRFLAEDTGISVDFSKQFRSGVIAGAYAAKTDLSAEEFGEGSFTKGFYISIPFDLLTVRPSRSRAAIAWTPLTRDGGQMLGRKRHLHSLTDARSPWLSRPPQDQ